MEDVKAMVVPANGNSETMLIADVIDMLNAAPTKEEAMEAFRSLRRDNVKEALGKTIRAVAFDRARAVEEFLLDGEKAELTRRTYCRMLELLFRYLDMQGLPVIGMGRADVNRYVRWLKSRKLSVNTVRLAAAAAGAFWKYLELTEVVQTNPWARLALPRRQYKKAVRVEGEKTIPVMSEAEAQLIMDELRKRASRRSVRTIGERRARESARMMLPLAMTLAETGIRIGDAITLRRDGRQRASFRGKGDHWRTMGISPELWEALPSGQRPFARVRAATFTMAMHRLTMEMCRRRLLRHPYTPHDFRHMKAVTLYRSTKDVLEVQRTLGHASLSATQTYLAGIGAISE